MKEIGEKIRKIRELKNFSQDYVAERLGISQSTYARLEKNEVAITEERLRNISDILDVSVDFIKNFDERVIFNITQGPNSAAGINCDVHNYQISPELKKLYEDKINLLEEKLNRLLSEIEGLKK